jgi:mannosyltransferase
LAPLGFGLIGALVFMPGIGRSSLWWDECHSLMVAGALHRLGFTETLARIADGLSPYFLLLSPWVDGSTPEWLVRLPSALAAATTAGVAWVIGRDLCAGALAWRLGLAVAMSPFLAWHAREARWYSFTWLFVALSLWYAMKAVRRRGWRDPIGAAAWGLLAAATFAPAAVTLGVTLAAIALVRARRATPTAPLPGPASSGSGKDPGAGWRRWALRPGAYAVLLLALAGLAWGWRTLVAPGAYGGAAGYGFRNVDRFSPAAVAYTPIAFATGYTLGPGPSEWHARPLQWPTAVETVALGAGVCCLTLLAVAGRRRLRERGAPMEAAMLVTLVVVPAIAVVAAAAWTGHRFAPRHVGQAFLPAIVLAAAGTLTPAGGRRARAPIAAALVLIVLQAVSLANMHLSPRYLREQVGPAARHTAAIAREGDLILVFGGIDLPWRRYDPGLTSARIVHADDPGVWTPDAVRTMVAAHDRIILVRGLILRPPEEEPLLRAIAEVTRLEGREMFPGVDVEVRVVSSGAGL